ncbi:MAG: glycosyltransferase [Deltaproteobacteria bacterium]|nr:glycosyltransferase [Deltaproteobacteria bacterium]
MNILQVNAFDDFGGAARIAWNLFESYRGRGHRSWLAVGHKGSNDPNVFPIPNDASRDAWARLFIRMGDFLGPLRERIKGAGLLRRLLMGPVGQTRRWHSIRAGSEDFDFPGTGKLLDLLPARPDLLHGHNLHGRYFDLRRLPWFSAQFPVFLTLHDAWLLGGHCAHSFDCERWEMGCGHCPDLTIPPAVSRDATAENWQRKRRIYAFSRVYVATPSRWLMRKVEQSILAPAVVDAKVIPNGIDLSVFCPGDRHIARQALGIPEGVRLLLSTAKGKRRNIWQDYEAMEDAIAKVSDRLPQTAIWTIVLGRDERQTRVGLAQFHYLPREKRPDALALYYQAADIYMHPSRTDTFPSAVLEALGCGIPVLATAVGGIPEQVKGCSAVSQRDEDDEFNTFSVDEATGVLVPSGEGSHMAGALEWLLEDNTSRHRMGENAARDARRRFDLNRQVDTYLQWYEEIVEAHSPKSSVLTQTTLLETPGSTP